MTAAGREEKDPAVEGRAPTPRPAPTPVERPSLLNLRGSGPLLHRAMPAASGAVAWGLVALVAALVGYLLWEGGRHVDGEFLSGGVSRGAYFRGGTIVEVRFERGAPPAPAAADGAADLASTLLTFDVASRAKDVAVRGDIGFEADAANPAAQWRLADGTEGKSLRGGAVVDVAGGAVELIVPFDRDTAGARHEIALRARDIAPEVAAFTVRFMVQVPLRVQGAEALVGSAPTATSVQGGPIRFDAVSGWRPAAGAPISLVRVARSGVWPMIVGTVMVTLLMTVLCVPFGVLAAVYLHEYARRNSPVTRVIRGAINNLAGVPSIVFGLFGLGFFIAFCGQSVDRVLYGGERVYGQPCVLWASFTLAVLTLPVVIVSTEEALRAVPDGLRMGSLALGATRWQTVWRIAVPQAFPGILTGMILAVSRGAGEVAPILFTGATNFRVGLPSLAADEKFMHLGYHVYALATQSPDVERTRPLLFATVAVLLALTFLLNLAAVVIRARLRSRVATAH